MDKRGSSKSRRSSAGFSGLKSGGVKVALHGDDKLNQVKSAFAERAVYKDYMKGDGVDIEEDKSFNRGAEPVKLKRNRSSIVAGDMLIERHAIPKEYFVGAITRNPFAGTVYLDRAAHGFDFSYVDLFDRDFVMGSPEQLGSDIYLFRPVPLGYRSWIYHQMIYLQEMHLSGKSQFGSKQYAELVKADLLKAALAFALIDDNTSAYGRYSPFQVASVAMLFICLTVDIPMMFAAAFLFFATFACTINCNHPHLFKWHRLISLPARFPITIAVAAKMGDIGIYAQQGKWIPVATIILAFLMFLADHTLGDIASLTAFAMEKKFEIQRILPGGVYLCSVSGGEAVQDARGRGGNPNEEINPDIVGADYLGISKRELQESVLLVDIQGILCELKPCTLEHWREQYRYGRHVHHCFSSRTFSNLRPDGEFFQKDGTFRNLYEIMGLKNDGSFIDENAGNHRRSFLGRRGTYQVTAPMGGFPGVGPAPPTEDPPNLNQSSLSYAAEDHKRKTRMMMKKDVPQVDPEEMSPRSPRTNQRSSNASVYSMRPHSAPAGPGGRRASTKASGTRKSITRPQSAVAFQVG